MQRKFLAAAVALAPLLGLGDPARAETISSKTSTPVATATADNGAPADITIAAGGTVAPTSSAAAVTLNSNNTVTNQGAITFKDVNNAEGVVIDGGFTGQLIDTGSISLTESYTPKANSQNGLADGVFAQGDDRIGIQVIGSQPFTGGILAAGSVAVSGNTSFGIDLEAPITGDLLMLQVNQPTTSGGTPTITNGSVSITGQNSTGIYVAPTSGIGGNLRVTTITALGPGARALVVNGAVGGSINISGAVTATGYRSTSRPTLPALAATYAADQLQQGGPTVSIGASVGKGLIVSAPPFPLDTKVTDQDGDGVPDAQQGTGAVSAFGMAPAIQVGSTTNAITLGEHGTGNFAYGFIVQGNVAADGVYDPLTSPNLGGVVPATAIQIGGMGAPVSIAGGFFSSGTIAAVAYQANATAVHLGAGAQVPLILNTGGVTASSTQINSSATGPVPVNVTAFLFDKGAQVGAFTNYGSIAATLAGTSGVGGSVGAVIDNSGSLTTFTNGGAITAALNNTVVSAPMPGTTTAVDMSAGTAPETFTQGLSPNALLAKPYVSSQTYAAGGLVSENNQIYEAIAAVPASNDPTATPALWKPIGVATPSVTGDMRFGSGGTTFTVTSGTVTSNVIDLGSGNDSLTVNGPLAQTVTNNGTVSTTIGASVAGSIELGPQENGQISLNVASGTLNDTNPIAVKAGAVNVGANGVLIVAADPVNNRNTDFLASGNSTFAAGAQVGLTLQSLQLAPTQTYVVVQTTGTGTLSAGAFGSGGTGLTPFLYTATPSYQPAANGKPGEIVLTVTTRTPAQLGFDKAEASAFSSVLAALPGNSAIQANILSQTTQAGLQEAYDQLLPGQGQGIFQALDAAAENVAAMTAARPDAGTPVAADQSLWLQEVNEREDRRGIDSVGSNAKLLGLVAGYEKLGVARGAVGLLVDYFNDQEADSHAAVGAHVIASLFGAGAYYRLEGGPLTLTVMGGGGYGWFSSVRRFVEPTVVDRATSSWNGFYGTGHILVAYEQPLTGRIYLRPEVSADLLYLSESAHQEQGGGAGFDLNIASRASSQASAAAVLVVGTQFGKTSWLRPELRAGYREVFAGQVGDTTASFVGGSPFVLAADKETGGWATFGFSIKGGSAYSYIALEGDLDLRARQERYDLRIAGRTAF